MARLLGIDVGGSAIKGGLVDVDAGRLVTQLTALPTPKPATPQAVLGVVEEMSRLMPSAGPIGFAFPSVVQRGLAKTAAHVDPGWIGTDGAALVREKFGRPAVFLNDADAAGLAEVSLGAGRGVSGTVIMLTFGTGIGSAIFVNGRLLPNTEFGHMELRGGMEAEEFASARVKTVLNLDWREWSERVNVVLDAMHRLFWPDLFIIGGGVSEDFDQFASLLRSPAEIRRAMFGAEAGVIGAALAAASLQP
jgi:polyphosphate glucokinase